MRQLVDNIYCVGAVDWDRRLFDELIPLPEGTSYNAYLIRASEKTALLDTVDPTMAPVLIDNLVRAGADRIDYIVAHHGEQDHSGAIPDVLLLYPEAKVVANPKCRSMLGDLLHIGPERFVTVEDGQELSLGDKTLQFVYTPWVHWPETMGTYLKEDRIFFSCDFFGSHLATSSLFVDDEAAVYRAAKRYYAEIMMPFRVPIAKNLEKLKSLPMDIIAPSHGPVYSRPDLILDAYTDWISDNVTNEVVLPYISMHDSTRNMVEHLVNGLIERNIGVKQFNLSVTDVGELAMSLVDAATIVLGSPTVLGGAHPKVAYAAILANALRPKVEFGSIIGSYGWGGRMVEQLTGLMPHIKAEILAPVIAKGNPKDEDFGALDGLADAILARHRELGIAP
jgi:flavorubredoxin